MDGDAADDLDGEEGPDADGRRGSQPRRKRSRGEDDPIYPANADLVRLRPCSALCTLRCASRSRVQGMQAGARAKICVKCVSHSAPAAPAPATLKRSRRACVVQAQEREPVRRKRTGYKADGDWPVRWVLQCYSLPASTVYTMATAAAAACQHVPLLHDCLQACGRPLPVPMHAACRFHTSNKNDGSQDVLNAALALVESRHTSEPVSHSCWQGAQLRNAWLSSAHPVPVGLETKSAP